MITIMNYGNRHTKNKLKGGELVFKTGKKIKLNPDECKEFDKWVQIRIEWREKVLNSGKSQP